MIRLLCINKLKPGPELELIQKFQKQINWPFEIIEFQSKKKVRHEIIREETLFFEKNIKSGETIILLDESGKNMKSLAFAEMINQTLYQGQKICFMIGGADGFEKTIKEKAHYKLSFGQATWPHMLCRVMLVEQVYRAQSILTNHPYHREGAL